MKHVLHAIASLQTRTPEDLERACHSVGLISISYARHDVTPESGRDRQMIIRGMLLALRRAAKCQRVSMKIP